MKHRILVSLCTVLTIAACSSERPPTSGESGMVLGAGVPPARPSADAAAADADADADADASLCGEAAAATGDDIAEVNVRSGAPAALGGVVAAGTYVLTAAERFEPDAKQSNDEDGGGGGTALLTGTVKRGAIVVRGDAYQLVEAVGSGDGAAAAASHVSAGKFRLRGTSFIAEGTCPSAAADSYPYSATAGSLIFFRSAEQRETYVRR
jgi:hypothetical protein